MPTKSDWRKFKISFKGGISEQFEVWGEIILDTLSALSDAARLLAGFAETSTVQLLTADVDQLYTRTRIAQRTFEAGGTDNLKLALELVPIIEKEAQAAGAGEAGPPGRPPGLDEPRPRRPEHA